MGTAILIKNNIKHKEINTSQWQLQSIECTAVLVSTSNRSMCILSAYKSTLNTTHISTDLEVISDICHQNNWDLVIGGDFNARHPNWNNINSCNEGRALANWMMHNSIQRELHIECPSQPTFRRGSYSSVLDFFIISSSLDVIRDRHPFHLDVLDYDSDHHAVLLTLKLNNRIQAQERQTMLSFRDANWSLFKNQIDIRLNEVHVPSNRNLSPDDIDSKLEQINDVIKNTIKDIIPSVKINADTNIILPQEILDLIYQKKRMRRRWDRTRTTTNANQLRTEIKLLSKIIDERISQFKTMHWTKTLSSIKMGPQAFKQIKRFTNKNCNTSPKAMTDPVTGDSMNHVDDIVNILGNNFENVHKQNDTMGSIAFTNEVNHEVITRFDTCIPNFNFSFAETADSTLYNPNRHLVSVSGLKSIIKSRANKKSAGHDGIPNIVLRKLPHSCIVKIATIFNQMYNISHYPEAWKHAIVIPIRKPNKPENTPSSYRPISLLPCLSKIYECAIKDRINTHCENNNILPDDQYGFRSNRTTTQALVILKTDIGSKFNQRTPTIACAMDIEKAFDTVWQQGIVYKMHTIFGFNEHLCRCIYHYLKDRTFQVKVNSTLSCNFKITAGVPQGGVLSALLYIIYVADIPSPQAHHPPIQRLQYADDILVYLSVKNLLDGESRINNYLSEIVLFFEKWKIKINPNKSEAIVFKGPNKRFCKFVNEMHKYIRITINNTIITPQKSLKYLGVHFTKNLTHIRHVDHIIKKVNSAYFSLRPVLKSVDGLNKKLKMICYKQLIRPIIFYGFPSWSDISSHQMERLRQIERVCLRACTNSRRTRGDYYYINNSELLYRASINRIDKDLVEQALKFFAKPHEDCPTFQASLVHDPDYLDDQRTHYKPPSNLSYLNTTNRLYTNNLLLFYHRPFDPENTNTVYNTNQ